MVDCKYCRMPLYTTWTGKCRTCGKQAGFFRQMGATQTLTQRGAIKDMHRKMEKAERAVGNSYGFEYVASPPNVLHGMTWQAAEELACKWMRRHGYTDAKLTAGGADGGIDVLSRRAVAQVKHHAKPVGISEMQRIHGIAASTRKKALFFSASGFTPKALAWAKKHRIECYTYPKVTRVKV
ncbi:MULTISPECIES: restriction endonuclease [Rhodococcoides]|uniref:Restriction endonuclease n=1 Tax=Rhodococcoides corynebacterioides TaxID=53972 RepID=A0ABS7P3D5_9NOCA|nr:MULTISPECIES: restriction endonuclease [Rhodococcus]MBT1194040.1 restriction endonuclease [Rhodococcus kroppenstedtii]MBY6366893.1 restriction endonuclease [Rhodococcus corynebacterioides]MBY6407695.1 restriction endonuclease [Rhodococcus corynebacterioides]